MAKVKITGHASGTGVVTVTAPNTSTDRTITLPDATCTLADNSDVTTKLPLAGGDMTGALEIQTAQVTGQFDRDCFLRLHPSAHTNSGGFTNMMFGTSTTNNYGVAIGGLRAGTDNAPSFRINMLNDSVSGFNALTIDSTGAVTMPKQPAFSAQTSGGFSLSSTNTLLTIPYNSERFDQNADFNTSTYTFTAPVTGKYQFNVITRLDNVDIAATYYHVYFTTSNRNYYDIFDPRGFDQDLGYLGLTVPCLADMDANDTAIVKIYQAGGAVQTTIAGTTDSHFSGYLVC